MTGKHLIALILSLFLASMACTEESSDIRLAGYFYGEKIDLHQLDKYVLVVHFWSASFRTVDVAGRTRRGDSAPRAQSLASECLDEVILMRSFYEKYRDEGAFVVGVHSYYKGSVVDQQMIWDYVTRYKIPYTVVTKVAARQKVEKIPYTFVYDVGGKFVYGGEAREALKKARELLINHALRLLGNKKVRYFPQEAKALLRGKKLGYAYKKLLRYSKSKVTHEKKRQEAQHLVRCFDRYIRERKLEFDAFKKFDPAFYVEKCKELIEICDGHEQADRLRQELASLKQDKAFQKSLEAQRYYDTARRLYCTLDPRTRGETVDLSNPRIRRKNSRRLSKIRQYCRVLTEQYPSTYFASQAMEILDKIK